MYKVQIIMAVITWATIIYLVAGKKRKKSEPLTEEQQAFNKEQAMTNAWNEAVLEVQQEIEKYYRLQVARLSLSEFKAYAHSGISGLGMGFRNQYQFWGMYTGTIPKSDLYRAIERKCHGFVHPDSMSDMLVGAAYYKSWEENKTVYEIDKHIYQQARRVGNLQPVYPFDVRIPSDPDYPHPATSKKFKRG